MVKSTNFMKQTTEDQIEYIVVTDFGKLMDLVGSNAR